MAVDETLVPTAGHRLGRTLTGNFALAATVGGIIGLGILRGPGEIAEVITNPWRYLLLWLLVGLFVLLSTVVVAELIGMTPRSGGPYALVRQAYGPYPGFVIGWVDWLSFAADIALKAVVIIEFTALLIPAAGGWHTELAVIVTTLFAAIQLRGVALSAGILEISTAIIGLAIVAFALLLMFAGGPGISASGMTPALQSSAQAWSFVIAAIVFTYDGWTYAAYFSGETKGGAVDVARSCIRGVVVIIALYLFLNVAMLKSVGLAALAGQDLALAHALELAVSPLVANTVVIAAIVILLSHQNLSYMGAPRILHALSADGLAMRRAQTIGRGGNPVFAVLITWALAVALIFVGGFEFLLLLCVFFFIPLYMALIAGVLILRHRAPGVERPFRAWGHPWSTSFVLLGWTLITAFQAYAERETALYALAMVAVSLPVYHYLYRKKANQQAKHCAY